MKNRGINAEHGALRNGPNSAYILVDVSPGARLQEFQSRGGRLGRVINTDNRFFGINFGSIVVVAIVIFIFSGGELGGKRTIESDDDLPPVTTTDK